MVLKVIGTGSKGNAYVLENEREALLIECGVRMADIKYSLKFKLSKLAGCIVTHEHKDHSKSIKEVLEAGIFVWASKGTHEACGTLKHHRAKLLEGLGTFKIGGFKIMSFDVKHDAKDPVGFIIHHEEIGKTLFLTDSFYCPYTFPGLNNIIIEANYSKEIIKDKLSDKMFLHDRVLQSHMSLETCMELLAANDLRAVNNIVLIHLSDSNSNEIMFQEKVKTLTQKNVHVAYNGMEMQFYKTPF